MKILIVTGSNGLIGSQSVKFFSNKFDKIIGIDNDYRSLFFGKSCSTKKLKNIMINEFPNYLHKSINIINYKSLEKIFSLYNSDIKMIIHTAAQPSHDWAASDPILDYQVNSTGTLNLLELSRKYCPASCFIFTSTNKVYGDRVNNFKYIELKYRYEPLDKELKRGIAEDFSIDNSKHSLFGCSKLSSDLYVQEYGKYFGMKTGVFRGGCLTGPNHQGAELHGFLSYLVKCNINKLTYTICGYKGKQVRDNIHSSDLINMFFLYYQNPRKGEVYNCGGGRENSCSILEAIKKIESKTKIKMKFRISSNNRIGDHKWYITNFQKFKKHYPNWELKKSLNSTIEDIINQY